MAELTLCLNDEMMKFVEEQASKAGVGRPEEYVHNLIRDERKRQARQRVEALLLEGLNSGPPIEADDAFWEEKLRRLEERWRGEAVP